MNKEYAEKSIKEKNEEAFTEYWIKKTQGSDLYQDKPSPETPSICRWALQIYADIFKYTTFFAPWLFI